MVAPQWASREKLLLPFVTVLLHARRCDPVRWNLPQPTLKILLQSHLLVLLQIHRPRGSIATLLEHGSFLAKIHDALLGTKAVQNFDLCISEGHNSVHEVVRLDRNVPWKHLLSQNVRLALWPRVLARANAWTNKTSYSPFSSSWWKKRIVYWRRMFAAARFENANVSKWLNLLVCRFIFSEASPFSC